MTDLPEADAETRNAVLAWLDEFAGYVRTVDYAAARPMFLSDVVAFGTHTDFLPDLDAWVRTQWDNVWPHTTDFSFTTEAVRVLASPDRAMAVAIAPWTSTGYHPDGTRFDRPGRATMVLQRHGGRWLCVHSHMALNRGVPPVTRLGRPVKAW